MGKVAGQPALAIVVASDRGSGLSHHCDSAQGAGPMADDWLAGGGCGAALGGVPCEDAPSARAGVAVSRARFPRASDGESPGIDHAVFQRAVWELLCWDS